MLVFVQLEIAETNKSCFTRERVAEDSLKATIGVYSTCSACGSWRHPLQLLFKT